MKKNLLTILLLFSCITFGLAQSRVITGKVTDQKDGSALPGVSVTVKGLSGTGSQTGVNGTFSLTVPGTAKVLLFQFLGFKPMEMSISNKPLIVQLESDSKQLSEVVVVGYGTQTKASVTGSIASVSSKQIEETPVTSLEQAMQGKVAGVVIQADGGKLGQGINIRVRGSSSVSAGTQPLYILDGIPITTENLSSTDAATNPIADINFNDIESVQILKDASASAIYGARASNGVIVITTKKGKAGATKINFSAQFGSSTPSRHRQFLNSKQYVALQQRAAIGAAKQDTIGGGDYNDALASEQSALNDELTLLSAGNDDWKTGKVNTNWEEQAFQKAPQQQYDLNLSGGNDKTTYYIGGQYLNQTGIVLGNSFKRYSGRVNLDTKVDKNLSIGTNLSFANTINNRIANDDLFSTPLQGVALSPITPLIDPRSGLLSGSLPGEADDYPLYYNPLLSTNNAYYQAKVYRTIGNVYANWEIIKGLTFRSEFGIDQLNQAEDSYFGRLTFRNTATNDGFGENTTTQVLNYNTNNYFSYKTLFGTDHSLDLTLGTSYQNSRKVGNDIQGQEFPSDAYKKLGAAAVKTTGASYDEGYTFLSYFLRANYAYKGKYLISGSARTDGSSRFGSNSRYGFFPSGSVGWIMSEEDFLKNSKLVSNLKARFSYGLTGNAEIGNFSALGLFSPANYNGTAGQRFSQVANPNLKWETTAQLDAGVDFGFFNNRLTGSFDYYKKNTRDLLLEVNLPGTLGIANISPATPSTQLQNLGKLYNKGFELQISSDNLVGKFKWTTSINASYNKNIVTDIKGQVLGSDDLNRVIEGQPIGVFYGHEYAGVDPANGDALYYLNTKDANGNINRGKTNDYNAAQNVVLGSPTPKYTGGITNIFGYNGIELAVTFQGVFGNKIYNQAGQYMSSAAGNGYDNQTVDQLNYWNKPGDITNVPEPRTFYANGTNPSSRYISSGTYVRCKTVTLAYNLPKDIISKVKLERVKVFVNAYNLFVITKYKGWDPEVNTDYQSGNINLGVDFYSAPQPRTVTFGFNVGL
ncbi:SusC/RagA family TonB-linked outer membrane protein [Mucilaginibacter lappiensis]|uniref:TonB-linked SusC/RagA family outer membrane protein n=1 Tax=Mucilaginibacter lappiensis TaxID=354630 RepID=A0A841JNA8_9SPHI|nr:TonB-dependent receptor [Mucilaginibacter lappiensis]MBB6130208.1 TonB-linked SusC/RagA family outer membrane protein [Mucilaginibacter lappiensis]